MGCCTCCEPTAEGRIFKPARERWCTDILCLLMFIAAWAAGITLAVVSINKDTTLLTDIQYPPDSYGMNCGEPDTGTSSLGKVIYPQLNVDINDQLSVFLTYRYWEFKPTKVCAASCPDKFDITSPMTYGGPSYPSGNVTPPTFYYSYKTQDVLSRCFPFEDSAFAGSRQLCASPACTDTSLIGLLGDAVSCTQVEAYPDASSNVWEICGSNVSSEVCAQQTAACDYVVRETNTDTFASTAEDETTKIYTEKLASYTATVIGAVDGLLQDDAVLAQVLFGIALPICLAFVWAVFLWFFTGLIVYTLIVALVGISLAMDCFFCYKAGWFGDNVYDWVDTAANTSSSLIDEATGNEQTMYAVLAVIGLILTLLLLVFIFISRKAIKRLIAIVKECTKVFKAMIFIVIWPLFQLPIMLGILAYCIFILYYIIYVWTDVGYCTLFVLCHLALCLWSLQFVKATTWSAMSGAVAKWFVTDNAPDSQKCCKCGFGFKLLCEATGMIFFKHLGSMAFGALIIAICQLIRLILASIDYYTQKAQDKNFMLKLVIKCSQCVMWCLQKTIEFISYYGFIFVALQGDSFCKACVNTFAFVAKYPTQTIVNKMVQSLLKLLIGWTTPIGCALITFYWLDSLESYKDFNAFWPSLVVFVLAYLVADGICMVYDCAIDTIYLSAFKDMEENKPPKFMSDDLREGFGIDSAETEAGNRAKKYESVSIRKSRINVDMQPSA